MTKRAEDTMHVAGAGPAPGEWGHACGAAHRGRPPGRRRARGPRLPSRPRPLPRPARHLVLVTIDTLRADRLGAYGNAAASTPHLDRLAAEGALAPQATAHVPLTRPSHASILTGLHPAEHGLRDNVSPPLAAGRSRPGGGAQGRRLLDGRLRLVHRALVAIGAARGFDPYSDQFEKGGDDARFLNTIQKRGDVATAEAAEWLARRARRAAVPCGCISTTRTIPTSRPSPTPRASPTGSTTAKWPGATSWWAACARRSRHAGLLDQTLVVVTSDHGEGLGEHGESAHGYFAYETTLRVPLIFSRPGRQAGRASAGDHGPRRGPRADRAGDAWRAGAGGHAPAGRPSRPSCAASACADEPAVCGVAAAAPPLRLERPARAA